MTSRLGCSCPAGMMTDRQPLKRPPMAKVGEWQDAFYIKKFNDARPINQPSYVPYGHTRVGPFSTYEAAVTAGMEDDSMWNSHFTVERVYVAPGIKVEYIDLPTPLADESTDTSSQFSDTFQLDEDSD